MPSSLSSFSQGVRTRHYQIAGLQNPKRRSVQVQLTSCTTSFATSKTLSYMSIACEYASDRAESQYSSFARPLGQ